MLCSQMAGVTWRSDWVGCPRWHLPSPSGTSAWAPGTARDGWASLCLCGFSTWLAGASSQHGGLEYSDFWWQLTSPRASFLRAPDGLHDFLWLRFWNHIVCLLPYFTGYPRTAQVHMEGHYTRAWISGGVVYWGGRHFGGLPRTCSMIAKEGPSSLGTCCMNCPV